MNILFENNQAPVNVAPARYLADETIIYQTPLQYIRSKPTIYGPLDEKLSSQRRWFESEKYVTAPEYGVYKFSNAHMSSGVVFTSNFDLVKESLINRESENRFAGLSRIGPEQFTIDLSFFEKPLIKLDNAILLKQQWDQNYGHWLVEGFPRAVFLAGLADVGQYKIILSEASPAMKKVYSDSLSIFGIKADQLFFVKDSVINVENLIYPCPLTRQPWIKSPLVLKALAQLAETVSLHEAVPNGPERILIDRSRASRRRLLNFDKIKTILVEKKYSVIDPAKYSLYEQISYFRNAKYVVGVLGAECTNFVFSTGFVNFLGLAPDSMQDDFYWDLISLMNGSYCSIHGPSVDIQAGMNSDFTVDLTLFTQLLTNFDVE